jgi:hypothetical protein
MPEATVAKCDIAIVGGGLTGTLLVLAMRRHRPQCQVAVIEQSGNFGGQWLEVAVRDELPAVLAEVIEPAIVKQWPGCFVNHPAGPVRFDDVVVMCDPRQLHLEMLELMGDAPWIRGSRVRSVTDGRVVHDLGEVEARLVIDASDARIEAAIEVERLPSYRDFNLRHDLDLPIIADMTAVAGAWDMLQMFPVDSELMVVEHLRHCPDGPLAAGLGGNWPGPGGAIAIEAGLPYGAALGDMTAAHFPTMLQVAAELAAGLVAIDLTEDALRSFFAARIADARVRVRRMFAIAAAARGMTK